MKPTLATLAILACLLCGCLSKAQEAQPNTRSVTAAPFPSSVNDRGIVTVEHDGHKLIIWVDFQKGGILHHPDCPCQKREKP